MNIFYTNQSPASCAFALDDKRVGKMLLESTQILSTITGSGHYKPTHQHHPATKWAAERHINAYWLYLHAQTLASEWRRRFGTMHRAEMALSPLRADIFDLPDGEMTPRPNLTKHKKLGLDFTHLPIIQAYRAYLNARWANEHPTWTDTNPPTWRT